MGRDRTKELKGHTLAWDFKLWAGGNGVSLEHEDDWGPWWDCFLAGAEAGKEEERGVWQSMERG